MKERGAMAHLGHKVAPPVLPGPLKKMASGDYYQRFGAIQTFFRALLVIN
jgi:hypothetical protein